ncbi:hypothetical protein EC9_26890 [Rosistilla ulvae]|uniref:Uncharacterized protein n=1 Tax=Rosistilla ulvae TaxID=1930277 RepID=A0A517M0U1_9BACT|nr:hypothetical protein [Rosistilla ulvae]QDS88498.1 hypothetical protein EC9_26890 [Rosistilla ulvae]
MLNPELILTAEFYVKTEADDWIPPDKVELLLRQRRPSSELSWEIGRKHVEANIERLQEMGCPPILLKSSEHVLDKTLHVSLPIQGSESRLEGFTTGFSFYDGCMSLRCNPFDIGTLKLGAKRLAADLDLNFDLRFGDEGDLNLEIAPGAVDFEHAMNKRFAGHSFGELHTEETPDWESAIRSGIRKWLEKHPDPNLVARWLSVTTPEILATNLCQRIESIDTIVSCGRGFYGDAKWHDNFLVRYQEWTAVVNLPGVPEPLIA